MLEPVGLSPRETLLPRTGEDVGVGLGVGRVWSFLLGILPPQLPAPQTGLLELVLLLPRVPTAAQCRALLSLPSPGSWFPGRVGGWGGWRRGLG